MNELEGGTGSVALFFGEVVVLVQARFGVLRIVREATDFEKYYTYLLLDRHGLWEMRAAHGFCLDVFAEKMREVEIEILAC